MGYRGKIANLNSNNTKSFVGLDIELQRLHNFFENYQILNSLIDAIAAQNRSWHLILPQAPNFGGIWEGKFHVKSVVGNSKLIFEELYNIWV